MRRSFAGTVEATVLVAYAAGFLQAGTQGLESPMKMDPQVILVHRWLNYRHPRRVRKSLCPEEGQAHGCMPSYSALQIEPIFPIVLIPESA
jgi:hypothetical protein